MKKKLEGHKISKVDPDSIAGELELSPGDYVLAINGNEVEDIFDYEYYVNSPSMTMLVRKADGEEWELDIENDYEDLGLTFENGLMSDYRSCCNKCIFCFIDQMPPGMRETLYFKDDDSRLSFLQGNYITLANMKEKDIDRIIRFKLSPINISVQTTNPVLRCRMLNNRFAGRALGMIDRLYEARTPMNGQVVLCKGVNDGEERHDGYIQLENGVGMLRLLSTEVEETLLGLEDDGLTGEVSIATGRLPYDYICKYAGWVRDRFPGRQVHVYPVTNEFFGESITVSGLLTGQDLIKQLSGRTLGEYLLLPINMFRSGEEVFLDDVTKQDLEKALQVKVRIVKSSGYDFVQAVLHPEQEPADDGDGEEAPGADYGYEGYELDDVRQEETKDQL